MEPHLLSHHERLGRGFEILNDSFLEHTCKNHIIINNKVSKNVM